MNSSEIVALLNKTASILENTEDLNPLFEYIGDVKYALLVEGSMVRMNIIHGELK
ncbi:hypothetical protein [Flavobacterium sp. LB3R33]|uniref:hypothetical protein n=1 Tax=Flavobacterium sp. LB3R33 TaxID=3401721 RepID=UPI003AAA79DC